MRRAELAPLAIPRKDAWRADWIVRQIAHERWVAAVDHLVEQRAAILPEQVRVHHDEALERSATGILRVRADGVRLDVIVAARVGERHDDDPKSDLKARHRRLG